MFKRKITSVIKAKNPEKGFEKVMDFINVKCNYGTKLELLNEQERIVYLNYLFANEIDAGGFAMLFFHPAGVFVYDMLESLTAIGAVKCAQLLQEGINFFPAELKDATLTQRQDMLEVIDPQDTLFLELNEALGAMGENLEVYQKAYILKHHDAFGAKL